MQQRPQPIRTLIPARLGLGVAQVGGKLHAMLSVDDDETGGTIDIIVDKSLLGEIVAHSDNVRRRIEPEEVPAR